MQAAKAGNAGFVNTLYAGYNITSAKSVPSPGGDGALTLVAA